ncbi:metal-dependent hydrolase [Terrilactibacillus sp. BCM23-1]|uniref:Metal-dependent hydrolase n=1 Tax=Terrilactibacillus tamarindi TaxID=2599694 RepID=A0A6N8CTI5_9BACI|nr:metal-dependent hydrolase [Terrilactibacillus tamarindi]MTT31296.1 metal-dependent hydrolase [Terrilactibacillus tamarindi]
MTGKTHIVGGLAAALISVQYEPTLDPFLVLPFATLGSLLPDICHSGSKIGRKLPVLARLIRIFFGHRTMTHSLLFLIIIGYLGYRFVPYSDLTTGLMIGIISHLILDAATKQGIKLLFPLSMSIKLPITTHTGSRTEKLIRHLLSLYIIVQSLFLFHHLLPITVG